MADKVLVDRDDLETIEAALRFYATEAFELDPTASGGVVVMRASYAGSEDAGDRANLAAEPLLRALDSYSVTSGATPDAGKPEPEGATFRETPETLNAGASPVPEQPQTGLERSRNAIRRARGGDAPVQPEGFA